MVDRLPIKTKNYWAYQVLKVESNGNPFIAAHLKRKYGEGFEDIDAAGDAKMTIGIESKQKKRMIWDNDPNSETFQQRIPDPNDYGQDMIQTFTMPMTPKIVEEIGKMCGPSNFADTQYYWLFHGKNPIMANSLKELTEGKNGEILKEFQNKQKESKKND